MPEKRRRSFAEDMKTSYTNEEIKFKLNEYQKSAVEDDSPACIVRANVGSGKTTVLISKVIYLHEKKHVPYENMVVLTFTNKAAGEIKERLLASEPELGGNSLDFFGTFHSVALALLKTRLPVESLGWQKDFNILEPEDELALAEALIKSHKLKVKYKNRLRKRLEQEYEAYIKGQELTRYKDDLYRLFELLDSEKKRQNQMTFRDLIANAVKLLGEADVYPDWIIIDEVQDSDKDQLDMVAAMKGEHTHIFAVGDPNQLIYSWRGSMETVFYAFKSRFNARELTLPVNYRSSASILAAARRFLQFGNELIGNSDDAGMVEVRNHYDPFQEAVYLAQRFLELHRQGINYSDIAVFYRLQNQADVLEKVFTKEGIPFVIPVKGMAGTQEPGERPESGDSVNLMTLHASKGLEFKMVFIIGVNQGLIPLAGSSFEQEEEERRLFFVGMTRAKEYLELSFYTEPGMPQVFGGPGKYLRWLPPAVIHWEGEKDANEKRANLQQLRKQVQQERMAGGGHEADAAGIPVTEESHALDSDAEFDNDSGRGEDVKVLRHVHHPKYGDGVIINENDLMVEVMFDNYGEKEFLKAFCELTRL